ncbi:citrate lyase acyl carrier protein [Vagococcus entomophilus]|uniref:Citrate lyase acyl carrier protein n=1 Tax=Vagococcus entomophilus TaxID=1160095 RepID=A0A430AGV3_9ENTE|nr:citrate lyase acyl carrier protein [Vagococcus entomophilus]RSU07131.1 citrate lyase acyl carrier protein [Vagococcus entomophilus]
MKIEKTALAGTLESSDIQIMLSQGENGIEIELESQVMEQFGKQITKVIRETLVSYGIDQVKVKAVDKGALDCTIQARTRAAIQRSLGKEHDLDWEALV